MSLKALLKSLQSKEVLLPALKRFLLEEKQKLRAGEISDKDIIIRDAEMTIATFKERMDEYNHNQEIEGEYFHPSQLGGCLRAAWFKAKKAPKNKKTADADDLFREAMIFETGTYVGVMFQNLCERAGFLTRREIPIQDKELRLLGHADGEVLVEGTHYILEIKTINARGYAKLTGPMDSHKRQIHAYMKALKRGFGIIVYLEKDRHQAREFVVQFDQTYYNKFVRDRLDTHFVALRGSTPPEQEGISPTCPTCYWCPYTQVCFGTFELKAFLKTLADKPKLKSKIRFK